MTPQFCYSTFFFFFCFFLLHVLLLLQYTSATDFHHHHHNLDLENSTVDPKDPQLQVFFTAGDLRPGKKMPIYFSEKLSVVTVLSPPLLSREEADSIPFHSSQIPVLLRLFSFPYGSPQAKAIESTLRHCEFPAMNGETKFCATSLESLLDSVKKFFRSSANSKGTSGLVDKFKVITTKVTAGSGGYQNYTIIGTPEQIWADRIVGCHTLPYPYAVYYCHSQVSDNKLFKVSLAGKNGGRIEAAAMCHMNTSQWNRNHVAFLVLKTEPGKSSVCHFFPADNLIWIPSLSSRSIHQDLINLKL